MTKTEKTKTKLMASLKGPPEIDWSKGLSSGLTLVNLACTGRPNVAFLPGHYYLFVGDSGSAKTWLMKQVMAELANNKNFNDYRIIDDNPERGSMMDHVKFFGSRMAERLEPPSRGGSSSTTEEFYDNVDTNIDKGPCFYGLDSEDALTSEDEVAKAKKNKSAREKGGETKGSYGDGKAKKNSSGLRTAHNKLDKHGSILVIIKQTRDNIGFDAMFNPKTRSGGRALTFYAALELWFSVKQQIKRNVKGKPRIVGSVLKIHVKKNRFAGRNRAVEIPFYPSTGLDDTGSMVNWLIDESHWEGKEDTVIAPEFNFEGKKEKLVHLIEEAGKEKELRLLTAEVWNEIEDACEVNRKRRYQ